MHGRMHSREFKLDVVRQVESRDRASRPNSVASTNWRRACCCVGGTSTRRVARRRFTPRQPSREEALEARIAELERHCGQLSLELATVKKTVDGGVYVDTSTCSAPAPHPQFSRFFAGIKQTLGFGLYVPDCDTTACAFSAATQAGSNDPILDQPLPDFYTGYQVEGRRQCAEGDRRDQRPHRL